MEFLGWVGGFTSINAWVAANSDYPTLSLEAVLGTVFAPLMWLIGVAKEDMMIMGQLLGIKLAASEFVGYIQLADLKNVTNITHLKFEKSIIMATYMLCGFANFASIGIQIGGIGSLAPGQRKTLSKFGMKALLRWYYCFFNFCNHCRNDYWVDQVRTYIIVVNNYIIKRVFLSSLTTYGFLLNYTPLRNTL